MRGAGLAVRLVLAVIVALIAGSVASVEAQPHPSEAPNEPSVERIERGQQVVLMAHNPKTYPITMTVTLEREQNVQARPVSPATVVVQPGARTRIMTVGPARRNQRWTFSKRWRWQPGSSDAEHQDDYLYTLPFPPGHAYRVRQGFDGEFSHQGERALDWAMPEGTPIHAARDGLVVHVVEHYEEGGARAALRNRDNRIYILHDDQTMARYLHLMPQGVAVEVGQRVEAGEVIGYSGNTGYSRGPHLHFDIYLPEDGNTKGTVPMRFALDGDDFIDGAAMQIGDHVMRPFEEPPKPGWTRPLNLIDQLVTTPSAVQRGQPVDHSAPYPADGTVHLYVGIRYPGQHKIDIIYEKQDAADKIEQVVTVPETEYWGMAKLNLAELDAPAGQWKITASMEGLVLSEKRFDVE